MPWVNHLPAVSWSTFGKCSLKWEYVCKLDIKENNFSCFLLFHILMHYNMITPSHYHHCANFIWRHWTYKVPVRYNLSSVGLRLSIFSQLSIIGQETMVCAVCLFVFLYNMWGCVFSVYQFPSWWLREYTYFVLLSSSNRKYELLPIVKG